MSEGVRDYLPESPYPGIDPFGYADRNVFFAREREARTLIRLIVMYRGVLLYADSGMGKSSLVNAGLIPLAVSQGFQPERIRIQPRTGEEVFVERLSENIDGKPLLLPSVFASDEDHAQVVLSTEEFLETLGRKAAAVRPLLIFDQFEEWVTLFENGLTPQSADAMKASQEEIRDAIVSLLNDRELPVKVLVVLREDYLAKLGPLFERCPNLPDHYLRLGPLNGPQVHRTIRGPFERYPGRYQPELSLPLADDIQTQFEDRSEGSDIQLTEVQIVCRSLFETGLQGPALEEYFADQKGVQGILEEYLERALESLEVDQQDPAVALLARMVTSAGTRNVISEDDLLRRVELEEGIPGKLLSKALDSLEGKTKLVRRERRREVYYYEISSEFLVEWIQKKGQERQRLAERRKAELEAAQRAEEAARRRWMGLLAGISIVAVILAIIAGVLWRQAMGNQALAEAAATVAVREADAAAQARATAEAAADARATEVVIRSTAQAEALVQADAAKTAEAKAVEAENLASERLDRIATGIKLKVIALSQDPEQIEAVLKSPLANDQIRFGALAIQYPYRDDEGRRVYNFRLFPIEESIPGGLGQVALITYRMDHPTFRNSLLATGPDRDFTASYDGWGCLEQVIVVIEYADPDEIPSIASFDMCEAVNEMIPAKGPPIVPQTEEPIIPKK